MIIESGTGNKIYGMGGMRVIFGHTYQGAGPQPVTTERLNIQVQKGRDIRMYSDGVQYLTNLIWRELEAKGIKITGNHGFHVIGIEDKAQGDAAANLLSVLEERWCDPNEMIALANLWNERLENQSDKGPQL